MPFSNPIIGGNDTLIRDKIQSENYVAGVAGWRISRNGDAEFNNLVARGSGVFGPSPGRHVEINTPAHLGEIALFSGNGAEVNPAVIGMISGVPGTLQISSDSLIQLTTPIAYFGIAPNRLQIDGTIIMKEGEAWHGMPLVNSWVDVAGGRANYFKDATGRVQLQGQVVSGVTTTIATLPAGYRPSQSMEWVMRSVGGVTLCAVQVANSGVMTVTANAAAAQASGIKLDSISFPTL